MIIKMKKRRKKKMKKIQKKYMKNKYMIPIKIVK